MGRRPPTSVSYSHLNLLYEIKIAGKGTITYIYDAAGNKLKKTVVDETASPVKKTTTTYVVGAVYENEVLQFVTQEEGRIRPVRDGNNNIIAFAYDYFLKDHLGNVRMVLTDEIPKAGIYQAGMEDENRNFENQLFDKYRKLLQATISRQVLTRMQRIKM